MDETTYRFLSRNQYCVFGNRGCNDIALNVYETEDALLIVAELAGTDPNSLQIEINTNTVNVKGVRQVDAPENPVRIHRMEIGAGPFEFEVSLKMPVDANQSSSRYHRGLLEIVLPLIKAPSQRIVINVQEGDTQ